MSELFDELRVDAPERLVVSVLEAVALADTYAPHPTAVGDVFVAYNTRGISSLVPATDPNEFEARFVERFGRPIRKTRQLPDDLRKALDATLDGKRAKLQFDLRGRTPFERDVLEKAREIPAGQVRPYNWVASEIGRPRAVRAVGSALGRNPIPILIPCHRVVRVDGRIGHYAFGTAMKRALLEAEGVDPDGPRRSDPTALPSAHG